MPIIPRIVGSLVPAGARYPFSSEVELFAIGYSPVDVVPAISPLLTKTIPSYLYAEYKDDEDLQALVEAYNETTQQYVDWFNSLNLPIYTGAIIVGALLDWVAAGLYGITRPVFGSGSTEYEGPYDTFLFDTLTFDGDTTISQIVYSTATDDVFKRVLTWHFFKGDGRAFTIRWLKRRIMRFLVGTAGTAPNIDQTYQISVTFGDDAEVNITIVTRKTTVVSAPLYDSFTFDSGPVFDDDGIVVTQLYPEPALARVFKQAVVQGVLEMPFQFDFSRVVVQVPPNLVY